MRARRRETTCVWGGRGVVEACLLPSLEMGRTTIYLGGGRKGKGGVGGGWGCPITTGAELRREGRRD